MRRIPWLLLLISQAPFPVVVMVVLMQGQGQHFCALQPLMVARDLWPALCPTPRGLACRDQAQWAVKWPRVGGASFTPVQRLLVFSAQPACVGSPKSWLVVPGHEHPSPAQASCVCAGSLCRAQVAHHCNLLYQQPFSAKVCAVRSCPGLRNHPWAQEPSLGCEQEASFAPAWHNEHTGFALLSVLQSTLHPHAPCCFLPMTHTPAAWLDQCYFSLCHH